MLVGDIHGHYQKYLNLISEADYSVQLGDFGLDFKCLEAVDSKRHKIVLGNHDNYGTLLPPHSLGDFGTFELAGFTFFFIRGGYSIDHMYRTPNISWWANEQLSYAQWLECEELFAKVKPDFVLSHDCPRSVYPAVVNNRWNIIPSLTAERLEACFNLHQPKRWVFGHHHFKWTEKFGCTRFHCVEEFGTMRFGEYD